MWKPGLVLAAITVVGCSSSSAPTIVDPTNVDVTIAGTHYHAAEAISAPIFSGTSGKTGVGMVVLSSTTDACAPPDAQVQHPGQTTIVILLRDGADPPTGPGTYTVIDPNGDAPQPPPPRLAVLYTTLLDASCANNADDDTNAVSG